MSRSSIIPFLFLCTSCVLLSSCADIGPTPDYAVRTLDTNDAKIVDTFEFGLPSVYVEFAKSDFFLRGRKWTEWSEVLKDRKWTTHDAIAKDNSSNELVSIFGYDTVHSADGPGFTVTSATIIRPWRLYYSPYKQAYALVSDQFQIHFGGELSTWTKTKPTVQTLRQAFGGWIIFAGDDMSRVRKVTGQYGPELVLNNGKSPEDTYSAQYAQ